MFLRPLSQVDFASSLYTSPASSQRSYGAREVPVPSKKKKYINPLVMQKEESLLILKWLSRQTDKTIFYESDFPAFSLRASEYELNTEPPLLLMKQDTSEQDKRYFYLIGDEFHDGKFGVKIYRVKGVFTLCRQHIYFRDTPGLLVKKQIHSDELSCERTRREYEFNIAAGYSQAGFYFVDRKKTAFTTLFFMDAVNGLNLDEFMKERQMYTSAQLLGLCFNAISALRSIHQLGVVHRDVKPANLVADTSNRDNPVVKLIDFDMSKPAEEKDAGSAPGTIGYAAPEIFNGESTDYKSDVFSLGMVFSEILGIHYLMNNAKKQTPGTDSPFILLDTKRYSPELASRLTQFLIMMTRIEKTERCSLDEAEIELGRIILYHQGELLKNIDQKHFSFSKAAACDKLQKLSVSGCAREITAAVKLLRQANELVQKIRFKNI